MIEKPKSTTGLLWRIQEVIDEAADTATIVDNKMCVVISIVKFNSAIEKTEEDIINILEDNT